jgi:hypothetical protein
VRLSLHVLYALAALAMVTAAASLGSEQGLRMARPGGDAACRGDYPDRSCAAGGAGRAPLN